MTTPLLEVDNLTIQYRTKQGPLTAVSDASFTIDAGEYYGFAGESGSGKTTLAKAIIGGLDDNGEIVSGTIKYRGEEIQDYSTRELNQKIRWKEISWIPQGAMNSLDPLQRVDEQALEIARTHTEMSKSEAMDRFREMFEIVGIQESRISDHPHQFSGGMQQRAMIALALFLEPSLIIADEPTTALDVIMQDQIFKYLDKIRETTETSMMLITHDISVIFESCDSISIMHGGQVAESGSCVDVYDTPRHPYSILLQNSFPDPRFLDRDLEVIEGDPPVQMGEINACTFAGRCPWAVDECRSGAPALESVVAGDDDHQAACVRKDEVHELYEDKRRHDPKPVFRGDES
jgi:oligopeptide/dipeptide ABC transporter ATP-binding protein